MGISPDVSSRQSRCDCWNKKFGSVMYNWTWTTQSSQCLASPLWRHVYLLTCEVLKSNFLRRVTEWLWGRQGWSRVGTVPAAEHGRSPRDEPRHMTANTRHIGAELDPREATPYPEFSCVRSGPPPRCLDAARSYSWLLRCWERREKSFNLALRFSPRTRNGQKRLEPRSPVG